MKAGGKGKDNHGNRTPDFKPKKPMEKSAGGLRQSTTGEIAPLIEKTTTKKEERMTKEGRHINLTPNPNTYLKKRNDMLPMISSGRLKKKGNVKKRPIKLQFN